MASCRATFWIKLPAVLNSPGTNAKGRPEWVGCPVGRRPWASQVFSLPCDAAEAVAEPSDSTGGQKRKGGGPWRDIRGHVERQVPCSPGVAAEHPCPNRLNWYWPENWPSCEVFRNKSKKPVVVPGAKSVNGITSVLNSPSGSDIPITESRSGRTVRGRQILDLELETLRATAYLQCAEVQVVRL